MSAPPYPRYTPPPPPPRAKRRAPWIVLAAVAGLVVGIGIGGSRGSGATATTAAPTTVVVTVPAEPEPEPFAAAAPPAPAPAGPLTTFDDGTYEVGVDVEAGKYKTSGSENCYWSRLKENDGSRGDIIKNDIGAGPRTVTINDGEYFETQRCGTWTKAD